MERPDAFLYTLVLEGILLGYGVNNILHPIKGVSHKRNVWSVILTIILLVVCTGIFFLCNKEVGNF